MCTVHLSKKLFTKHDSRNTKVNIFLKEINFLSFHAVVLEKTFLLMYQLLQ